VRALGGILDIGEVASGGFKPRDHISCRQAPHHYKHAGRLVEFSSKGGCGMAVKILVEVEKGRVVGVWSTTPGEALVVNLDKSSSSKLKELTEKDLSAHALFKVQIVDELGPAGPRLQRVL
jgi:hypothetical protein